MKKILIARLRLVALILFGTIPSIAQQPVDPHAGHQMPVDSSSLPEDAIDAHDHSKVSRGDLNAASVYLMTMNSGTSLAPKSWPMPMLMPKLGSWNTMFMGQGFVVDTQQGGLRGRDKLYSANWIMGSAIHTLGAGSVMLQTMFSQTGPKKILKKLS